MIKFTSMALEGFGSIVDPLLYNLNKQGINVLQAKNGVGKTTIFSGLSWILYGKTLKNRGSVQTWENLRGNNFKGTKGSVIFYKHDVRYEIIRLEKYKRKGVTRKVSELNLTVGGVATHYKSKADTQEVIIEILGFSLELFKNSVIFGQKMKRIIEEDGPTKKKVFDEAFNIGYLQIAKEKVQEKSEILTKELNESLANLSSKQELYKELLYQYENTNKVIREFEKGKIADLRKVSKAILDEKRKIKELEDKILLRGKVKKKIKKYQAKLDKTLAKRDKQNVISNKAFTLDMEIQNWKGKIMDEKAVQKTLVESLSKFIRDCPRCGQKLTPEHIKQEKLQIKEGINESKKRVVILNETLLKPEEEFKRHNEYLAATKYIPDRIRKLTNELELAKKKELEFISLGYMLEAEQKGLQKLYTDRIKLKAKGIIIDNTSLKDKLEKIKPQISKLEEVLSLLRKTHEINNWLIKDPLSNSGIKAFIFNQMLSLVNERLKVYCNELGFMVNFNIDLESANKDFYITITKHKDIRFYEDLSGGEQQLTNICIAFAIHDVICMDKGINILVFDEVFESLDSDNVEVVANLINLKAQDKKCIHLITHHKDFNPTNAHIISIYKKKGRTYLQQ